MADQERRVVCVHDIPVDVEEVRRLMVGAPIKDESGNLIGTTMDMEGVLPTATFEVELSDGSCSEATHPFVPTLLDAYLIEAMEQRLRSRREVRLDALSSKGVEVRAAHPRAMPDRVDFLVTFAEFGAMVDGTWQLDIPPELAVEQTGRIARLIELSNLLRP